MNAKVSTELERGSGALSPPHGKSNNSGAVIFILSRGRQSSCFLYVTVSLGVCMTGLPFQGRHLSHRENLFAMLIA